MVFYSYRLIGHSLFKELEERLVTGQSVVLLSHRFGGKRFTVRKLADALQARQGIGPVVALPLYDSLPKAQKLAVMLADSLGVTTHTGDMFDVLDRDYHVRRRPVTLLIPNLDILPHADIQRILAGIRTRVEDRRTLTVLVGGDQHFFDFVHGEKSEFNCSYHYVLQGFEHQEFDALARQMAKHYRFDVENPAFNALWEATGGQSHLLEALFHRATELRIRGMLPPGAPLTVDEAAQTLEMTALGSTAWWHIFGAAADALRGELSAALQIEQLLDKQDAPPVAPLEPGPLEMAGLAVRHDGHLHFAAPVVQTFARYYFTPRKIADLHAISHEWPEAFRRYRLIDENQQIRPDTTEDRAEVGEVLQALIGHMSAVETSPEVASLFCDAARYIFGFTEVHWWRWSSGWRLIKDKSVSFPLPREHDFAQALRATRHDEPGVVDLPGDWRRIAVAARIPSHDKASYEVLAISDIALNRSISRDRMRLTQELFNAFLLAYDRTRRIQMLRLQTAMNAVVDSILESINVTDVDPETICRRAATGLRDIGYRRVLLCLVDPTRKRIRGVCDAAVSGPDVSKMTDWALDDYKGDLQPNVVHRREAVIVEDATKEPLANPAVVLAIGLKGFAIAPILDCDETVLGTIHVERMDQQPPSEAEVHDIVRFGRRLASLFTMAERTAHITQALNRITDPVAITDPSGRWRYANEAAAAVLRVPKGWRTWHSSAMLATKHVLRDYIGRSLISGENNADQLSAGLFYNLSEPDDCFYTLTAPIRSARTIVGVTVILRDFTKVEQFVKEVGKIVRSGSGDAALAASLGAMDQLGHKARLYVIQNVAGERRFVSKLAFGLPPEKLAKFNAGHLTLQPEATGHQHTWKCVNEKVPCIFVWKPDGNDGETLHTPSGLAATVVTAPEYQEELGKQPGDYWIDLPLFDSVGVAIGKLATNIDGNLSAQQTWILKILAEAVQVIVGTFRDREQMWKHDGHLLALSTISHHLLNRVISLDSLCFRYEKAVGHIDRLPALNRDFREIVGTITSTIQRSRDFLLAPKVNAASFDLAELVRDELCRFHDREGVSCDLPAAPPVPVWADRELVRIALSEILDNCRKALKDVIEPHIWSVIEQVGSSVIRVVICDNGPGIPPENAEKVFEEFYSLWKVSAKGTGLGLGWVRRVFEAHGGAVRVAPSTGGARIMFELPLNRNGDT